MAYDGFTSYEGNAVRWRVTYVGGSTFVMAQCESIALQRFMAKFPNRSVLKIERG